MTFCTERYSGTSSPAVGVCTRRDLYVRSGVWRLRTICLGVDPLLCQERGHLSLELCVITIALTILTLCRQVCSYWCKLLVLFRSGRDTIWVMKSSGAYHMEETCDVTQALRSLIFTTTLSIQQFCSLPMVLLVTAVEPQSHAQLQNQVPHSSVVRVARPLPKSRRSRSPGRRFYKMTMTFPTPPRPCLCTDRIRPTMVTKQVMSMTQQISL